jgi:streptogramin lyase
VWVLNANNETISRIDPQTRQAAGSPFSVAALPTSLAAGAGALWVGAQNEVLRVDPTTERSGAPIPVPGSDSAYAPAAIQVFFGAGQVYVVSSDGSIGRLDPAANKVVAHVPGPALGGLGTFLAPGPRGLWMASETGIDDLRPRRLSQIRHVPGSPQFPNGIAVGAGWVWVTDASGDSVWRIDPDGRVDRTIPVSNRPSAVTVGAGAVWVATVDGTITRLDPKTGSAHAIDIGGAPASLAIDKGLVWVAVA